MRRLLRLALAVWLTAPPAGAVALSRPAPRAAVAPAVSLPRLAAPALSLQPAALAPALAPLAAPSLMAAPAALESFAELDLAHAPPAASKEAGDALMAAVLGEAVAAPSAVAFSAPADAPLPTPLAPAVAGPSAGPRTFLLSKPLSQTARLGPVARTLHYVLESAMQFLKAGLVWQATGSPGAAAGVLVFELFKMPPVITAQSLADLGLRYWWAKLATLRRIADAPGVTRVRVLTTGETEFSGILAVRKHNTGLIFVDSDVPLPSELAGHGSPLPVADLARRRARVVLEHDGVPDKTVWTPTLGELLAGAKVPRSVARGWRTRLDADKKGQSALRRLFDFTKDKDLKLEAYLADGEGGETRLGAIAIGGPVKRLVGIGRWDRVRALFGGKPAPRALPLSDTVVERGGNRAVDGFWRRAWRRLTGRLLVRP